MKHFLYLIIILFIFSCEGQDHVASIHFQNKTKYDILVEMNSKPDYTHYNMYKASDGGSGYYEQKFIIRANSINDSTNFEKRDLYETANYNKLPTQILSEVFDSIRITICNRDSIEFFFSKEIHINYKSNIFNDNNIWIHNTVIKDFPTMLDDNETKFEEYIFNIDTVNLETK
jgi:hypothetical protein